MIKTVIIDEESSRRETLINLLDGYCPNVSVMGTAETVQGAFEIIKSRKPDLAFLDIELSSGIGFKVLEGIMAKGMEIIFVTSFNECAIRAFEFSAVPYLLRPFNVEKLKEVVTRVGKSLNGEISVKKQSVLWDNITAKDARIKRLMLPSQMGLELIDVDNIVRCQAEGSYTMFFLDGNKKIMVSKQLKEFESALEGHDFFRIHKAHLVNLNYVEQYIKGRGGVIIMKDGSKVNVSRYRKSELLKKMSETYS